MQGMLSSNGAWVYQGGLGNAGVVLNFHQWTRKNPARRVFMTEQGFNSCLQPEHYRPPNHSLVMFRDPTSHVISQYHHCKESRDHAKHKAQRMPNTLSEWLQYWNTTRRSRPHLERNMKNPNKRWSDDHFQCYVPLNFQSWLTGYPTSKDELFHRFDAIGVMSDVEKTHCVFLVQLHKKVPVHCDCTKGRQPVVVAAANKMQKRKRRTGGRQDHGVQHHGDTYAVSAQERSLIHQITGLDQHLYQHATELFEEHVQEIEEQHNVKLCGNEYPASTATSNHQNLMQHE